MFLNDEEKIQLVIYRRVVRQKRGWHCAARLLLPGNPIVRYGLRCYPENVGYNRYSIVSNGSSVEHLCKRRKGIILLARA